MFVRNHQWPYHCGNLYWHGTPQARLLPCLCCPYFVLPAGFLFSIHVQLLDFLVLKQDIFGVASFGITMNNLIKRERQPRGRNDMLIITMYSFLLPMGHNESGWKVLWMEKYQVPYVN